MQCEKCHTDTEAGVSYMFYYGRQTFQDSKVHYVRDGGVTKKVTETTTEYKMHGSRSVYLCDRCVLEEAAANAPQMAGMFSGAAFLLALFIIAISTWLFHSNFSSVLGGVLLASIPVGAAAAWAYRRFHLKEAKAGVIIGLLLLAFGLIVAGTILMGRWISFALGNILFVLLLTGGVFFFFGLPRIRMGHQVKRALAANDDAFLKDCMEPEKFQKFSVLAPADLGDTMAIGLHRADTLHELGNKAAFFTRAQFKKLKFNTPTPQ